jgi:hypothetical protein
VSVDTPYVAPWLTSFNRYSTQLYTPSNPGANQLTMVIPSGQWWRFIYITATITTGVTVANRPISLFINDPHGVQVLVLQQPLIMAASQTGTCLWMPGASGFFQNTVANACYSEVPMPDLLWAPGSQVSIFNQNFQGGDSIGAPKVYAVEVYTEDRDQPGVFVPTPVVQ